jgi:hypothetical protein
MNLYYRLVCRSIQVVSILLVASSGIFAAVLLMDWFGHAGWGYPWWSVFLVVGQAIFGVLMFKLMRVALRYPH